MDVAATRRARYDAAGGGTAANPPRSRRARARAPPTGAPAAPLIEEIGAPKPKGKVKPAVKAGFLRSHKGGLGGEGAELYPAGSEQGESQKEGTYSRFMSKCRVVDTSEMSKEDAEKAMRDHAAPQADKCAQVKQQQRQPPPPPPPSKPPPAVTTRPSRRARA